MSKRSRRGRRTKKKETTVRVAPGFMTVRECADDIGVTDQTILNWANDPKAGLKARRFGKRCVRIAVADWEKFKAAAGEVSHVSEVLDARKNAVNGTAQSA